MNSKKQSGGGFTLVELLVVIGIIAVLIGILLPALRKARMTAQTVACQSNLRQMVQATQMFAQEHGTYLPHAENNGSPRMLGWAGRLGSRWEFSDNMWSWQWAIMKYMNRNKAVFQCPADTDPKIRYKWNDGTSPAQLGGELGTADDVAGSYRMNASNESLSTDDGSVPNIGSNYNHTIITAPKLSQLKPADRCIIFFDGTASYSDQVAFQNPNADYCFVSLHSSDPTLNLSRTNPYNAAFRRHTAQLFGSWESNSATGKARAISNGQANYAFMDGHVATLHWADTWGSLGKVTTTPDLDKTPWEVVGFAPNQQNQ